MAALLRFLAGLLLIVAVIFAVSDATRLSENPHSQAMTVLQTWAAVSPTSLAAAQAALQRSTHPLVWQWGALSLLQLPASVLLGIAGLVLAYLGRRRRRVNIFAN